MDCGLTIAAKFIWKEFDSGHINILNFLSLAEIEQIKEAQVHHFMSYTNGSIHVNSSKQLYWYQRLCHYCSVNQVALTEMYGFTRQNQIGGRFRMGFGIFADQLIDIEIMKRI